MNKLRALAVLLVLSALLSLPCRKQMGVRGIELSVGFSDRVLTDDLFTQVTCRVKTSPSFAPIAEDNQIVLRLFDHGRLLVRDAFEPPIPTSKWEPDREYAFTRTIYIPPFIDEFDPAFRGVETVALDVGLGPPTGGADRPPLVVHTRTLRLVPAADAPVMVFLDGWSPRETLPGDQIGWRRWTGREARVAIDNPGRDALLVIRGSVDAAAPADQKITIAIDGRVLEEFEPGRRDFERRYAVGKDRLGARKDFVLTVSVDKTFLPAKAVPGSADGRELGVRISLIYFR